MSFTESIKTCISKIVTFSGRARRSEYWYFALFVWIINVVLVMILGQDSSIASVISIALGLCSLSVGVRRLHDIGKSGWWYLIGLIPVVGFILLIVWFAKDGEPGTNRFGDNPKEAPYV